MNKQDNSITRAEGACPVHNSTEHLALQHRTPLQSSWWLWLLHAVLHDAVQL